MRTKLLFFFFILLSNYSAYSQLSDYYNLKDVKKYRFNRLSINNVKDAQDFVANASEYNFVTGIKLENAIDIKSILDKTKNFYEFSELNLKDYKGDITDHTFDSCVEIEVLHLKLEENKLGQLSSLPPLKRLTALYLYIHGKPESLQDLKLIPNLQELRIIGDFLPQQLKEMVEILKFNPRLHVFGVSVDRVTDLPLNILSLRFVGEIYVYDNLSVFTNGGIEDLNEEKVTIFFNIASDLSSAVAIKYMSTGNELAAFETAYLEKLYRGQIITERNLGIPVYGEEVEGEEKFFIPFKNEFNPSFVKPVEFNFPVNDIKPKVEIFKIDPTKDAIITTNSGLRLVIAKNSFSALNSPTVTEPIYIKLSEIVSTSELLFGGVNLEAGQQGYYNNRYLINVQATTATSEVSLKENYQIKAILPITKDSTMENFFDYESNSWQDLTLYNSVFNSTLEPIDFYKIENQGNAVNYVVFDTSAFETRFKRQANFFLNDQLNDQQLMFANKGLYTDPDRAWKKYNQDGKKVGVRIKKGKALVKIQKVTPKKRNKERQYFKLVDRTEQGIFSELKCLKGINFNVKTNPENKRELTENFIKNYKYQDVRVDYNAGQNTCIILLKYEDGYKQLTAFITDAEDDKNLKKQLKKFDRAYKKYRHHLEQRAKSFDDNNDARYEEYLQYVREKVKANVNSNNITEIRLNQLGSFGLFTLKPIEFNTNLIVQYTDERGVPIDVKELFMIDSRYQTVISLDFKNLAITPSTCQLLFATDYNGDIYFANKSDIAAMNLTNNSLTYIKLSLIKVKLKSIEGFNHYVK